MTKRALLTKDNMTKGQVRFLAGKLRKSVASLATQAEKAASGGSDNVALAAETLGEILAQALALARKEDFTREVSKAAFDLGFSLVTFDAKSVKGSDAGAERLADDAATFSEALYKAACDAVRERN